MKMTDLLTIFASLVIAALISCGGDAGYLRTDSIMDVNVPDKDKKVISVLAFEDRSVGSKKFKSWGRGIPEQIMVRLSAIPYFRVVAREHLLGKLLEEQALQMTGITDATGTVKLGKMLNAQYMVTGSFQVFGPTLQITASVIDVETSQVVHVASVHGEYLKFFDLQNQVAVKIAEGLNVKLNPLVKQKLLSVYDTKVVDASLANYEGEEKLEKIAILTHQKKAKQATILKEEAKQLFKEALKLDTDYERAKLNLVKLAHAIPMTL